ncbi:MULTISPECIES: hypothetical protein [Shouchella]|uniref:Uncharacterized protein n=3 Tax=Bacillaceae TaxID=186817 RepID=A0A060M4Y5_9BACI|nr:MULTISPECIES: hypothetical protein [Bacillaceae]RQW20963.1 hypothetical protein EH196_12920 [Bacillus sp. C1-1]AIC95144.1 hypothetical protein BleG1_2577 [Shouchella lehensis G1]KQL57616.1 hypothetical protein AN965_08975 [Alkalicoccobacillus plakortidis]MBG9784039.1 hypothetical protein [Shouchella lehensis]TES50986.1 hypothetical protein E2L03_03435 [Shouchella lehensis]
MIPAQTFLPYLSFHNHVWPLFFVGAAIWLLLTWRDIRTGRTLIALFVRVTQILLLLTGSVILYMYQFMPYYAVKGAIALLLFSFFETSRMALKRRDYAGFSIHMGIVVFASLTVWLLGVNGR